MYDLARAPSSSSAPVQHSCHLSHTVAWYPFWQDRPFYTALVSLASAVWDRQQSRNEYPTKTVVWAAQKKVRCTCGGARVESTLFSWLEITFAILTDLGSSSVLRSHCRMKRRSLSTCCCVFMFCVAYCWLIIFVCVCLFSYVYCLVVDVYVLLAVLQRSFEHLRRSRWASGSDCGKRRASCVCI